MSSKAEMNKLMAKMAIGIKRLRIATTMFTRSTIRAVIFSNPKHMPIKMYRTSSRMIPPIPMPRST